jgi:2-dehydro-3-deoxygluconokinase
VATLTSGLAAAHERNVTVSLDLNYRESLWRGRDPRPVLEPLARRADVLIGNREAVSAMLGVQPAGDALASALADQLGCRAVAITEREILGPREHAWSAVLFDSRARTPVRSARHVVQVVDRVGGGDSFTAGLIAALLAEQSPQDAVEFAAAAGALKLSQAGDFGRSTAADVNRLVERVRCT